MTQAIRFYVSLVLRSPVENVALDLRGVGRRRLRRQYATLYDVRDLRQALRAQLCPQNQQQNEVKVTEQRRLTPVDVSPLGRSGKRDCVSVALTRIKK